MTHTIFLGNVLRIGIVLRIGNVPRPAALGFLCCGALLWVAPTVALASPGQAAELLQAHNSARAAVGVPPLSWDPVLAATALECANRLAASGQFRHCGSGENLWMGTAGRYSPTQMVGLWAAERSDFQPGIFPNVSRTGNWQDVGHYTQMVWRTTTAVGCAEATGRDGLTRLVCHYAPPGNVMGRRVF